VQSRNIEGLSTSESGTKAELDNLYGYGLDIDKLLALRDKLKAAALTKR